MLDAIRQAKRTINFETYIYWSGDIGREFVDRTRRARPGGRPGPRPDRLGRQPEDGPGAPGRAERRWRKGRALPPAQVVPPRAHEQPHPPQAPGRRRPGRLHGRRRHRRQLGRQCRLPRTLAGLALPHRGPRGRADAGCVPRQLDQDHGCRAPGRGAIFPRSRAPGMPGRRSSRRPRAAAATACSSCTCSRSRRPKRASTSRRPTSSPTS